MFGFLTDKLHDHRWYFGDLIQVSIFLFRLRFSSISTINVSWCVFERNWMKKLESNWRDLSRSKLFQIRWSLLCDCKYWSMTTFLLRKYQSNRSSRASLVAKPLEAKRVAAHQVSETCLNMCFFTCYDTLFAKMSASVCGSMNGV